MIGADDYQEYLASADYVSDDLLTTALAMSDRLSRPLLLEGEAGVGKTFVAQALAKATGRKLIRLQCYEGLDAAHAIYEWNHQRQILAIASTRESNKSVDLYSEEFLIKRPLLEAISQDEAPILLIDEIDRADEEFEAFLLEILSDFQVTIPELGVVRAKSVPLTILTSNGVRELSDALRRRCLFHYIDFPDAATELRIIRAQVPECSVKLAHSIASFIQALRKEDLQKKPGVAETIDWASALVGLNIDDITGDVEAIHRTLLCVLKTKEDRDAIPPMVFEKLVGKAS